MNKNTNLYSLASAVFATGLSACDAHYEPVYSDCTTPFIQHLVASPNPADVGDLVTITATVYSTCFLQDDTSLISFDDYETIDPLSLAYAKNTQYTTDPFDTSIFASSYLPFIRYTLYADALGPKSSSSSTITLSDYFVLEQNDTGISDSGNTDTGNTSDTGGTEQ